MCDYYTSLICSIAGKATAPRKETRRRRRVRSQEDRTLWSATRTGPPSCSNSINQQASLPPSKATTYPTRQLDWPLPPMPAASRLTPESVPRSWSKSSSRRLHMPVRSCPAVVRPTLKGCRMPRRLVSDTKEVIARPSTMFWTLWCTPNIVRVPRPLPVKLLLVLQLRREPVVTKPSLLLRVDKIRCGSSALTTYSSLNNNNDDDKDDNVGSDVVVSDGVIVNVGAVGSDMLDNVNRASVISDSVTVPELVSDCQLLMTGDETKLTSREDCSSRGSSSSSSSSSQSL